VVARTPKGTLLASSLTASDGSFVVAGLRPGWAWLAVEAPGYARWHGTVGKRTESQTPFLAAVAGSQFPL
jgi:hypothetical protein